MPVPSISRSFPRILAASALVLTPLVACGGDDPVAEPAAAAGGPSVPYGLVAPEVAAELATDPSITVIDVRTPEEYGTGHLGGATLIDFYEAGFADDIAALDRDGRYLIYCRSGNRSGQAFDLMRDLGFEQVYDVDGGILAWNDAGLALESP